MKHAKVRRREYDDNESRREDKRFYSGARWLNVRMMKLRMDPVCRCGNVATMVHHIVPRNMNHGKEYEVDNLESSCFECHENLHGRGRGHRISTR